MNYIVLDLEWNQGGKQEATVENLNFEIIEIGAVKLNKDKVMTAEFGQLIKPEVYHEMHEITGNLVHIRMQELEKGKPFVQVMQDFLEWCGNDYIFCTWGPLDLGELQANMRYHRMKPLSNGPIRFLDIQKLFSIAFEDGKSRKALETAVDFLNIEKDIPFHRAVSDAYYAGKVLEKIPAGICENVSYDVFNPPQNKAEEVHVVFANYAKYISRVFPEKTAALADREVNASKCYLCNRNLKKKIRWFSPNGRHYYCVAFCEKHGYMKEKVRIHKAGEDAVFVVKTSKFISQEDAEQIKNRREHTQEMRKKRYRKNKE